MILVYCAPAFHSIPAYPCYLFGSSSTGLAFLIRPNTRVDVIETFNGAIFYQ